MKKSTKIKLAAALLAAFGLTGCNAQPSVTGTVADKRYTAEQSHQEFDPAEKKCTGTGTKRKCKTEAAEWDKVIDQPETCEVLVAPANGNAQWIDVSCGDEYDGYNVGDTYPN